MQSDEPKIIITNVKDRECNYRANLNKQFGSDGKYKHSYEWERSDVSKPFAQKWGQLEVYIYTLQPGKTNAPYHYHAANEDMYYIISGRGALKTPDGGKDVAEGDIIIMPAHKNGAHNITNTSDEPLVYIGVQTVNTPDLMVQPESEKFVVLGAVPNAFLKAYAIGSKVNLLSGE